MINQNLKGDRNLPGKNQRMGEFILVFTNQQVKLKDYILLFPKKAGFNTKTRLPDTTDLREVRIIPRGVGYVVEIVYKKEFILNR
jgi:putative transposase